MANLKTFTITEQVAAYLRDELYRGRWRDRMPGRDQLASDIGASHRCVQGALELLEREGLLEKQGAGQQRRIRLSNITRSTALRVRIMPYEKASCTIDYLVDLRHQLEEAGHHAAFAEKSLQQLGMNPEKVAKFVEKTPADAWIVVSASREVLEWFVRNSVPTFALFGRLKNLPLAGTGPGKSAVVAEIVRHLVQLGHRRIVMLCREERRKPDAGMVERVFLNELETQCIATGPYNLPDWGNTREEFQVGLDALFRVTPPTAVLCSYAALFLATERYIARHGLVAPRDISMVCLDPDPAFAWCEPSVSHIHWSSAPVVRRVIRWIGNIARGREDLQNVATPARFIKGGTIGPVPGR